MNLSQAFATIVERAVAPVEGMHDVISGRWFAALGPPAQPVRRIHDAVASTVYGALRLSAAVAGHVLDAKRVVGDEGSAALQAWVDGVWGNEPGTRSSQVASSMSLRDRTGDPAGPDLGASYPDATGRLVVLVHGLVETERVWRRVDATPGLQDRIEAEAGLTAVPIRYNTGLRVPVNGELLSILLEDVCTRWPVPVESIALVGHSMGGLVVRSACDAALERRHAWLDLAEHVVTVGTPHRGAPLEKLAHLGAWGLGIAPETRPLARFLADRSDGIKDLRHGTVTRRGAGSSVVERLPAGIDHHFVAGVITADPRHPLGTAVGDLWVRPASGTAAGRLQPTDTMVVGGVHHFQLLRQPAVAGRIMIWLTGVEPG